MVSPTPRAASGRVPCCAVLCWLVTFHTGIAHSVDDCGWNATQTEAADKPAGPAHVERHCVRTMADTIVVSVRLGHCSAAVLLVCADSVCPSFSPAACSASAALSYTLLVGTREAVVPGDGDLTLAAAVVGAEKERRQERADGPAVREMQRVEVGTTEWMEAMVGAAETEAEGSTWRATTRLADLDASMVARVLFVQFVSSGCAAARTRTRMRMTVTMTTSKMTARRLRSSHAGGVNE